MKISVKDETTLVIESTEENSKYIEKDMFNDIDIKKIKKVILPEGLEKIYDNTFARFTSLEKINFPSTLKEIGAISFRNCNSLKHIKLNEGLEFIENGAFEYSSLEELYIPSTVTEIGDCAFYLNTKLNKITVSKDNTVYSDMNCNVIYDKEAKTVVQACSTSKIPEETKLLKHYCFSGVNIKSLTIPKNIERIDEEAFFGTHIEKVIIECNKNVFHHNYFTSCNGLKEIYMYDVDKETSFYKYHKNKIKLLTLDNFIEQGKSFKEVNTILKELEK